MTDPALAERLMAEVQSVLDPLEVRTKSDGVGVTVDLGKPDGTVLWKDYAHGPDELLAVLAAEQRYLVEEVGQGSVRGATYVDKARERLLRAERPGS